jgi:hypothetical protein
MTLGNPNLKDRPVEYDITDPGMAFFARTGPFGKTCGDCKFRGYSRRRSYEVFNAATGQTEAVFYRVQACAKFKELTGEHGPAIKGDLLACKYFEKKPPA